MQKDVVVAYFNAESQHLSGGTDENVKILRISGLEDKIQTWGLPSTKQV
jgi:hypothetical protein